MKGFLSFTVFLLLLGAQSPAQTQDKKQNELIEKQKAYFEAVKNQNSDFLEENLAEDYIGAYALGVIDKKRELSDLKDFKLVDYEMSQIKVSFPDKKTAIIAFKIRVKAVVSGKSIFEDDVISCIWTLRRKKWLLMAQSAAKICY